MSHKKRTETTHAETTPGKQRDTSTSAQARAAIGTSMLNRADNTKVSEQKDKEPFLNPD